MNNHTLSDNYLDLRGCECPVNFVRCCLALENLSFDQTLRVDLDLGEAETSVIEGLNEKGYMVKVIDKDSKMISLKISCAQE